MSISEAQRQKTIFAKNLNFYMNAKGISQADIVAEFDITASTVSDWCNAKKYPRVDKIQLLADHLGILKSDLTEEKTPQQMHINDYIQKYEALTPLGQQKTDAYVDDLLGNPRFRRDTKAVTQSPRPREIAAYGADGTKGTFTKKPKEIT